MSTILLLTGCPPEKPDLVPGEHSSRIDSSDPSSPKYITEFNIKNVGDAPSGPTRVYFEAISPVEHPGVNEIRYQKMLELPPIQPGQASEMFRVEMELHIIHAREIQTIRVIADPKVMVDEKDETNNVAEWPWQ